MPFRIVEFEETPNPNALMCRLDQPICAGTLSFTRSDLPAPPLPAVIRAAPPEARTPAVEHAAAAPAATPATPSLPRRRPPTAPPGPVGDADRPAGKGLPRAAAEAAAPGGRTPGGKDTVDDPEAIHLDPVVVALLSIRGVQRLMLRERLITVTKSPGAGWGPIRERLTTVLAAANAIARRGF